MKWDEQAQRLLRKAAADEKAMSVLIASGLIEADVIGFHAQQAAEKYLKALLSHCQVPFRRTHDLCVLLDVLEAAGRKAPPEVEEICQLVPYAVEFRYDDVSSVPVSGPGCQWMVSRVQTVRRWVEGIIQATQKNGS